MREVQGNRPPAHCGRPERLTEFRTRLHDALLQERLALQAATAIEPGVVSPAQLGGDPCPSEQGSHRVTEATTVDTAKKKSSRLARR